MTKEIIDSQLERKKLDQCKMFSSCEFLVTIENADGSVLFYPYMVSNFSIDNNKIFVTIYDVIQPSNIEEILDDLLKGVWIFRKKVNVILYKLDGESREVYQVEYKNCQLKKYHGKNLTYKSSDMHQWYLEFGFERKKIFKNDDYNFRDNEQPLSPSIKDNTMPWQSSAVKKRRKRDLAILKNTNKMLDDAAKTVLSSDKLEQRGKVRAIEQIDNAKKENERKARKYYGETLKNVDLSDVEKEIETQIEEIERNNNT